MEIVALKSGDLVDKSGIVLTGVLEITIIVDNQKLKLTIRKSESGAELLQVRNNSGMLLIKPEVTNVILLKPVPFYSEKEVGF